MSFARSVLLARPITTDNKLHQHLGVGTIPWSPLARGLLTRPRAEADSTVRAKTDPWTGLIQKKDDPNLIIVDR